MSCRVTSGFVPQEGGGSGGFEEAETEFNSDGSITTTYADRIHNTEFNSDGSITETLADPVTEVVYATKTTTFNNDGSISETVVYA